MFLHYSPLMSSDPICYATLLHPDVKLSQGLGFLACGVVPPFFPLSLLFFIRPPFSPSYSRLNPWGIKCVLSSLYSRLAIFAISVRAASVRIVYWIISTLSDITWSTCRLKILSDPPPSWISALVEWRSMYWINRSFQRAFSPWPRQKRESGYFREDKIIIQIESFSFARVCRLYREYSRINNICDIKCRIKKIVRKETFTSI